MTGRLGGDWLTAGADTADVTRPPVRPERVGIVHLGIGAFHRAHQAVFTEDALLATGDTRWGILGVTQRSATVRDQLRPQDGLFGVLTLGTDESSLRVVGSVLDVAFPAEEAARVLAAVAAPDTHVITLTVTEQGYARTPDGTLDVAAVRADLDALAKEHEGDTGDHPAGSAIGLLVRGLAARHRAGGAPITVLSCDNLAENGHVLERLVREAVTAALPGDAAAPLLSWLDTAVTFPASMVDRLVPATTDEHLADVAARLGVRDDGVVVAEPFRQWVVEDRFAGPRPAWERAGAVFTDDVRPWERAKLRLLNGTHSLIAYAGAVAGHTTISAAVADPAIAARARTYLFDDALPTLTAPPGLDLAAYGEQILGRFANPHLRHTTEKVATDGTQKIPQRWGEVLTHRLAAGVVPEGAAYGLAAWIAFVLRRVRDDAPLPDPRADELRAAATASGDPVSRLLALPGLLPAEAARSASLTSAVSTAVGQFP
ncbi:mannitol dehydrogenase family protein [Jiangella gansuensis]|uniref:mannitol dehydrogenase family protein n=1 Tax=Jiangella gansuensis TaxID=281473 RepID=UPI0004AF6C27|nr:mannitol dehydrogenase family protein [Jiangella gansuensis]